MISPHTDSPAPPTYGSQPLCDDLRWMLAQASHNLSTEMVAALEEIGISPGAKAVMRAAMTGEHTQIELARMVGLDKTKMVTTLDRLEAAGLAERRPSSEDRRARVIVVTEAGERKVREAERIADRIRDDVLATLPAGERKAFLAALKRLVTGRLSAPTQCTIPVRQRDPRPAARTA